MYTVMRCIYPPPPSPPQNLESLVRQPTGCGEQNMVKFAPNIYVMKYLVAVGELTETLKEKLIKHMKSGIPTHS